MRVLICGSRDWNNAELILQRLTALPPGSTVIHGACRGADLLADEVAKELGFEVVPFPARWDEFGRSAGPRRNQQMLDEGRPDLIVAFHNNISSSRGTGDMVKRGRAAGVPVEVVSETGT